MSGEAGASLTWEQVAEGVLTLSPRTQRLLQEMIGFEPLDDFDRVDSDADAGNEKGVTVFYWGESHFFYRPVFDLASGDQLDSTVTLLPKVEVELVEDAIAELVEEDILETREGGRGRLTYWLNPERLLAYAASNRQS